MMDIAPLLREAQALHAAGQLAEAERRYRAILKENGNQPDALHLLGVIAHQAGKHEAAIDLISRALPALASRPQVHNNLGLAYLALRRLPKARECFQAALALKPDYAEAHANFAQALMEAEDFAPAETHLRRALEIRPDHPDAMEMLGDALAAQYRPEEAVTVWRKAVERSPQPLIKLAGQLVQLGRHEEALGPIETGLGIWPNSAKLRYLKGVALKESGRDGAPEIQAARDLTIGKSAARNYIPEDVLIQVSKRCNLRCTMCGFEVWENNTGFMDLKLFERILGECRTNGIKTVKILAAQGEPFLHPGIFDFLDRAVAGGFTVHIVTNGTPLTDERIERLARTGLTTIQFSFGGFDKASYEGTYVGAKFEKTAENLKKLNDAIIAEGFKTTLIVKAVADEDSPERLEKTRAFLRSLGALSIVSVVPNNFAGLVAVGKKDEASGLHSYRDLRKYPLAACRLLATSVGIYYDGKVTACGCYDANGQLAIGDLARESLAEIVAGPRYRALLEAFKKGDVSHVPLCSKCDEPYGM